MSAESQYPTTTPVPATPTPSPAEVLREIADVTNAIGDLKDAVVDAAAAYVDGPTTQSLVALRAAVDAYREHAKEPPAL